MPIIVFNIAFGAGPDAAATGASGEGTPTIVFRASGCTLRGIGGRTACSTVWAPTLTGDDEGAWGTCTCT
jgi:hypothetical protein